MSAYSLSFGYFPSPLNIEAGPIKIETAFNLESIVATVEDEDGIDGDWIYAPRQRTRGLDGNIEQKPYSARVFGLPKTHTIIHESADNEEQLVFHIWCLSFFAGMRFTSTEAGFLDCTPIKQGMLFDFVLLGDGLASSVSLVEAFWSAHRTTPNRSKLVEAAIHVLLLSQNPQHLQFEKFLLLYTAFDACFALAKDIHNSTTRVPHAQRVKWMCDQFSIPTPDWASTPQEMPELAGIRNEAVHEALFIGQPLGFALHGRDNRQNITLEMQALVCRLLVALLGSDADYVHSPVTDRQRHGLRI